MSVGDATAGSDSLYLENRRRNGGQTSSSFILELHVLKAFHGEPVGKEAVDLFIRKGKRWSLHLFLGVSVSDEKAHRTGRGLVPELLDITVSSGGGQGDHRRTVVPSIDLQGVCLKGQGITVIDGVRSRGAESYPQTRIAGRQLS